MINHQLLDKFDRIEPLPVSEELLGAYLEGNLDMHGIEAVSELLEITPMLHSLLLDIVDDQLPRPESSDILAELIAISPETAVVSEPYNYLEAANADAEDVEILGCSVSNDPIINSEIEDVATLPMPGNPLPPIEDLPDDLSFDLPDIPFF